MERRDQIDFGLGQHGFSPHLRGTIVSAPWFLLEKVFEWRREESSRENSRL